jgi:hypothetical protein
MQYKLTADRRISFDNLFDFEGIFTSFYKKMRSRQWLVVCLVLFLMGVVPVTALGQQQTQQDSLSLKEVLENNRYPIQLDNGQLEGKGGNWLLEQAQKATIVTVGESHGSKEIPAIIKALVTDLQKAKKVDHLAIEVSPWTSQKMTTLMQQGREAYDEFIRQHPHSVPFYNFKTEADLLQRFLQGSNASQPSWGLDQIFAFATNMAFERLEELAPTNAAREAINEIRSKGKKKSADHPQLQNLPAGIPTPVSVYKPATFDTLHGHFSGMEEAQQILSELAISAEIYRTNDSNNYKSNQLRSRYLRDNLRMKTVQSRKSSEGSPQIMVKIGARHAYRSMTPNNALDVGNLAVSLARSMEGEAFNVAIVCGAGSTIRAFPDRTTQCSSDYLGKTFKSLATEQAMVFDLSEVHPKLHTNSLDLNRSLEEFLWGFDAVVLVPNTTPAELIKSSNK